MLAKRGHAGAQYNLGLFYQEGSLGLTQSTTRALEYSTLAVEQGHAPAQYNLGRMYRRYAIGDGVEQSYSKARELFTKAAPQGHENAIKALKHLDKHGL